VVQLNTHVHDIHTLPFRSSLPLSNSWLCLLVTYTRCTLNKVTDYYLLKKCLETSDKLKLVWHTRAQSISTLGEMRTRRKDVCKYSYELLRSVKIKRQTTEQLTIWFNGTEPSWDSDSHSSSQEITLLSRSPTFHYAL
jgi:hypothetical protein